MKPTCKCAWCLDGGIMEKYHDEEWGLPVHDDKKLFEHLMMEAMQCGLSWILMLKKRETFKKCFDDFDYEKIAKYDEEDVKRIMETPNMIKSIRKIRAVISNAQAYKKVIEEFGSFDEFQWRYSNHKTIVYRSHKDHMPVSNRLSEEIAGELRKRGFKYLGGITMYSHMQACGMINDHSPDCFRYGYIMEHFPIDVREDDEP